MCEPLPRMATARATPPFRVHATFYPLSIETAPSRAIEKSRYAHGILIAGMDSLVTDQ